MSKQTAVDWLEKLQLMKFPRVREAFLDAFNQAKQMEKEQIINTGNCVAEVVLIDDENYNGNKYWDEFIRGDHE
jgi:hypothetical protein